MSRSPQYGLNPEKRRDSFNRRWLYLPFMLLLALGASWWATQQVAEYYQYHSALGPAWFNRAERLWYAPWSIFFWQGTLPDDYGVINRTVTIAQAIFLAPQFVILGLWFSRRRLKGVEDLHGSARWADYDDIEAMGFLQGKGVYVGGWTRRVAFGAYLGRLLRWLCLFPLSPLFFRPGKAYRTHPPVREEVRYLRHDGPEHLLAFMPTRSGKGVGLIIPTLLAWPGSSATLDIKGENWALTSGRRKALGHVVLRFDPSDASGSGASFNPLEEIRLNTLNAIQDVQNLAMMLIDPNGKGLEDHWTKAAFAFFSGLILHACIMVRKSGRAATLNDLVMFMADESRDTEALLNEMLETDHAALLREMFPDCAGEDAAHSFVASSAREMLNKDEKESSGVLSSALVNMALYRDPIVAMNTARSDFHITDLMNHENPVDLYLVVSPADIDRVKPLMRLIMDMIVRRLCAKMEFADGGSVAGYKHRLLLMLDEFTSLGKLPIIEKAIAFSAGYGVKMYIIVQDITQLNGVYGKENGLMSNCHIRIAAAPNTIETAKILSEMTGKATVVETKTSLSGSRLGSMKNASLSVSETARPLLTPDECMRLPGMEKHGKTVKPGHLLIFSAGKPAVYGRQILYFQDPFFSAWAKIPPPGVGREYAAGITDSLYYPRPAEWFCPAKPAPEAKETEHEETQSYFA